MGISDNEHLAPRVQGAMRPSLQITWADEDGAFGPNRRKPSRRAFATWQPRYNYLARARSH